MGKNKSVQKGRIEIIFVALFIMAVTLLSNFSKELFVESTGNYKVFGNLGLLLALGLLLKWKYVRFFSAFSIFAAIIGSLYAVLQFQDKTLAHTALIAGFSISFYLLVFSKNVKAYMAHS